MTSSIQMLVLPGAAPGPIFGLLDLFSVCNRVAAGQAGGQAPLFQCQLVSLDGQPVTLGSGNDISVDASLQDLPRSGILVSPAFALGSSAEVDRCLQEQQVAIRWLADHAREFELVASHCSGSFLLAEAGLLSGERATTAWWLSRGMQRRYPDIFVEQDGILVRSGQWLTAGSTSSFQDAGLALIDYRAGRHLARLVAKYAMIDNQRNSQAPYTILSLTENLDPVVEKAEQWIRRRLAENFRIEDVADAVAVSPRTLIRRFQAALGDSPQGFIQRLRIEKSKILLETTRLPLTQIVNRCGYQDESAFRRLFHKYCQLSPREYRRRFSSNAQVLEQQAL